ncbi:hypothetical protein [Steroidobacter agaridevorans]|nr:hypothetical protein [Steroidobacter agaridevorans]
MAEMLRLPAYEQLRILAEQKHPKQAPQIFRTPYYQPAIAGVRSYYASGNDRSKLSAAKSKALSASQPSRRDNLIRVIDKFETTPAALRSLSIMKHTKYTAAIGDLQLRLSPDIQALDGEKPVFIYYNCRSIKLDEEAAKLTLEIAHWVLDENGINVKPIQIEYLDLATGVLHQVKTRRPTTVKALKNNARIISALWPTI